MQRASHRVSDSSVIRASLAEPREFGLIFERYQEPIRRYLRRRTTQWEAEELAAETFVAAFESRARFDFTVDSAKPWLFGIATNLLRRRHRTEERQLRAYARSGVDPVDDSMGDADNRMDAQRAAPQLAKALAKLPPHQREVLLLHAWAGLSDQEIASAVDTPIGTVQSRLSRARRTIREAIQASGQLADEGADDRRR